MANVSSSNGLEKRPKLRFPGFDEPWRAAQLGDLLIELSDYTTQESGFPLLTSSRQGLFVQEDYFIDKQANAETTVFSVLPYGCITYRHMSDDNIFHFNINRLVANGLVSKEYPVFTVRKEVLDTDFLVDTLNSSPLFSVFCIQQKKGGTRTRLYFKTLCSYQMFLPVLHEQQVIASFIRLLGKRIERQMELVETLKKYKRGLLHGLISKMLRFSHKEKWECVKLGQVFKERSERANGDEELLAVTINAGVQRRTNLDLKDNSSEDKSNYKRVQKGDIAYNTMRMWQGASGASMYNGIVSPAYTVITPKTPAHVNILFWSYYFKYPPLVQTFQKYSQGLTSDTWNLKFPQFAEITVLNPSFDEQNKIANLLQIIDHRIRIEEIRTDNLRKLKLSLYAQLFI